MLFRGGKVFTGEKFEETSVRTEGRKIAEIGAGLSAGAGVGVVGKARGGRETPPAAASTIRR